MFPQRQGNEVPQLTQHEIDTRFKIMTNRPDLAGPGADGRELRQYYQAAYESMQPDRRKEGDDSIDLNAPVTAIDPTMFEAEPLVQGPEVVAYDHTYVDKITHALDTARQGAMRSDFGLAA